MRDFCTGAYCTDCPDHEACSQNVLCDIARKWAVNRTMPVMHFTTGSRNGLLMNGEVVVPLPKSPETYREHIAQLEREESCRSCRLSLPGHPCGHYWVDGVRYSSTSGFQLQHRLQKICAVVWTYLFESIAYLLSMTTILYAVRMGNDPSMLAIGGGMLAYPAIRTEERYAKRLKKINHKTVSPPLISKPQPPQPPQLQLKKIATMEECAYCAVLKRACRCKR